MGVGGGGSWGLPPEGFMAARKGTTAGFRLPRAGHLVDDLPRNTMGKVQKNRLRERFGDAGKSQPP